MAKFVLSQKRFAGGIADYLKESPVPDSYYFGQAIDYRNDPQSIQLLPGAVKESGNVVTDLLKWGDVTPSLLTAFFYGDSGNIYSRTSAGSWTNLHTVPNSAGNGLAYFQGDDYVYYTNNNVIGRYGAVSSSSPQFSDNFLGAQGGIPTNTASILLASASSMYASAADSASLSVTGNLTLETYFKLNSLPAVGSSMTLIGKWDENANHRSYIMDILAISGYFGDGSAGNLTISSNTTDAPIDSACTGTSGSVSLSATNVSFAANQIVFIHQTQGSGAGIWMRSKIQSYTAGTITLIDPLNMDYTVGAQVIVMRQYNNITINPGKTLTAKAWNGTVGGIIAYLAAGTFTNSGQITAQGKGFVGGVNALGNSGHQAFAGEGTAGASIDSTGTLPANGNGGGNGGTYDSVTSSGSGGGNATAGVGTNAGAASGTADLTTMTFGGGGGGAFVKTSDAGMGNGGDGGNGGGIIFLTAMTLTLGGGTMFADGNGGGDVASFGGGGGAAGSILLKTQTATLGSSIFANGGHGGTATVGSAGGAGSDGRITLDYLTSYTGDSTPSVNPIQDNTLVTTTSYEARLGVSSSGTNSEYLAKVIPLSTGVWNRLSISWLAASSLATFYLNAVSQGTTTGSFTSINDNTSLLYVGADKNATVVANFFDGLLNDMRIWNNVQTAGQIYANNQIQLLGNEAGLQAYYTFNSVYTDGTGNANTLTGHNTPTFSSDVPYPAPTTRLDIDQSYTVTGQDYDLLTSISEASSDKLSFTPAFDPQKSVDFNINAKGTGNWTVTVHDQQNNIIATQTIANASLATSGYQEFIYTTPWRIVIGRQYHMHLTSTVNDGSVVSSTDDNFSTGDFHTYYGFLVNDAAFHPIISFLNFLAIGNERYIATWDGASYQANRIALPVGWRVRCFSYWREYLAVGVWRGTNIQDYDEGRVYFWDGVSATFNFFIDVPEGQINAMAGKDTDLYMFIGYRGILMDFQGGYSYSTGNSRSNKIKKLPLLNRSDTIEVFPGAMQYWKDLLHLGISVNTTSTSLMRGVYTWGSLNVNYPDSLSYDYVISTGSQGTTVSIGMVYPVGTQLIIGWQDSVSFGADMVSFTNAPAPVGGIQLLVQDNNFIWKDKQISTVRGDHLPLASGESIDIKYKIDRATNYTVSPVNSTVGSRFEELLVQNGRGSEYQIAIDMYSSGSTSPTVTGLSVLGDDGKEEEQF